MNEKENLTEELETEIMAKVLDELSIINFVYLDSDWFDNPLYKNLVSILNQDKDIRDLYELVQRNNELYPGLTVNEIELRAISYGSDDSGDLENTSRALEKEYIQRGLIQATQNYAEVPSKVNYDRINEWIVMRENSDAGLDDGELESEAKKIQFSLYNDIPEGVLTFDRLDDIFGRGLQGGVMFVVGGRPGMGKTALAVSLSRMALLKNQNIAVDFYSLEMTKKQTLQRFTSLDAKINSYAFAQPNQRLKPEEKEKVEDTLKFYGNQDLKIYENINSINRIEQAIRKRHRMLEPGQKYMVVIDYLQLIESPNSYKPRHEQVGDISKRLKRLTNELNTPFILLSQLSRASLSRDDKKPTLADLRESGDIEQDANIVGLLSFNDPDENENEVSAQMDLDIAKNREGRTGFTGFFFNKAFSEYQQIG